MICSRNSMNPPFGRLQTLHLLFPLQVLLGQTVRAPHHKARGRLCHAVSSWPEGGVSHHQVHYKKTKWEIHEIWERLLISVVNCCEYCCQLLLIVVIHLMWNVKGAARVELAVILWKLLKCSRNGDFVKKSQPSWWLHDTYPVPPWLFH